MASNVKNDFARPAVGSGGDNTFTMGGGVKTGGGHNIKRINMHFRTDDFILGDNEHFVLGYAGTVTKLIGVLNGAQGGGENFILQFKGPGGNMSNGTMSFIENTPSGTVDTLSPTTNNIFTATDQIIMEKSGTPATGSTIGITVEMIID